MATIENQLREVNQRLIRLEAKYDAFNESQSLDGWVNDRTAKIFFDYGDTQFKNVSQHFEKSEIGRRKFYKIKSISDYLEGQSDKKKG